MKAIDVHTHVVPQHIPHEPGRDKLWPSINAITRDEADVIVGGKQFRRIDSRCWDVARRLGDMDRENIGMQVLSPMPELLSHWLAPQDADYLAQLVNESIAQMVAAAPDRFVGLGMIAAQEPAKAGQALERLAALGLSGIEIGTHINGVPLGDSKLWPIYEAAEAMNLSIFVHALRPCCLERMGQPAEVALVASFPLEIAMAGVSLMAGGVLKRFPRLRFLLSHGGGALPSILGRIHMTRDLLPTIGKALDEDTWVLARRFWYDSNVYDPETLAFLTRKMGLDRLVVGSDYPFLIRQTHPADFVENALPGSSAQCCANALAFLGRDAPHVRGVISGTPSTN